MLRKLGGSAGRQFLRKNLKPRQMRNMKAPLGFQQLVGVLRRNETFSNEQLQGRKVRPILAMNSLLFHENREWRKDF
jgi:hypothetical protein